MAMCKMQTEPAISTAMSLEVVKTCLTRSGMELQEEHLIQVYLPCCSARLGTSGLPKVRIFVLDMEE